MGQLRTLELASERILQWTDGLRLRKKLPHALCFSGVDYGEKKKLALVLAQDLLCEMKQETACGQCGSCLRVGKNQSEYLLMVEPEKEQIKIAEARRILDFLSFAANGRARVVIIDQAHQLNQNSANSILKTIEEPNAEVYFILLTVDETNLMPTIKSRVQIVRFQPKDYEQILSQRFPSEDQELAKYSSEVLYAFWTNNSFLCSDEWRDSIKDREKVLKMIRYWIALGRNAMISDRALSNLSTSPFEKWNRFVSTTIQKNFKTVFYEFLMALVKVESEISRNIDATLLIESLWVKYAKEVTYAK